MKAKQSYFIISLGFFSVLLLLGIYFAEERIVFMDNALQLFLMINDKSIEVMAGRYPAAIARILPFIGIKLHFSLEVLIYLFSISYILVQVLFLVLAEIFLKDKRWLIAVVLSLAFVMGNTFFWCNSELSQAIPFSILALGITFEYYDRKNFSFAAISTIMSSLILAFYHPQSLMVYLFGLFFFLPLSWKEWKGYILPLLGMLIFISKSLLVHNWYDTMKFEGLKANLTELYPNYLQTASFMDFYRWLPTQLLLISTVFLLTIAVLMARKKWYQCFLLLVGSVLSISVFHITNDGAMTVYYAEASYLVWSALLAIVFTFEVFDLLKYKQMIYGALLILCIVKILAVASFYVERQQYVKELANDFRGEKVIIDRYTLPQEMFMLDWALPFETYIHSTLQEKSELAIVVPADDLDQYKSLLEGKLFIDGMGSALESEIDSTYFRWNSQPYELRFK
jgi:hypothetical protein